MNNVIEIVKVVHKNQKYTDKSGKERVRVNYYVVFNNKYIAITPAFADCYRSLDLICKTIVSDK